MPTFSTKRRVPFTASEMYAVVADIERYPEFLPMCTGLKVTSRKTTESGEELVARMSVGYKSINEAFTTRVRLEPKIPSVNVSYVNGPFKHLENRWRFFDAPGGSEIDFYITYAFKSAMLGMLVGAAFDSAFRKFTDAFEARARIVYAKPGA
jgi:coenzyme Q-binding protein COQ10